MKENRIIVRLIRNVSGVLDVIATLFFVLIFILGGYKIWDSYQTQESATPLQYAKYKPGDGNGQSFEELQKINPEVIAWLTVYGTNIDYPVVQAVDNWKYLNLDVYGNYSLTGSIYMDCNNASDFSDFNSILYGHDMTPKVMFGNIKDFLNAEFFATHRYGNIYYEGEHHGLEFFSMVVEDAYDNTFYAPGITKEEERSAYLERLAADAVNSREVAVTTDDHILLLSSCSPTQTNMRNVLVAKITDETFEDPFGDETGNAVSVDGVDTFTLAGFLKSLPIWFWVIMILPILLLVAMLVTRHRITKGANEHESGEDQDRDGS